MKSEKLIREILEQYEFNLEVCKVHTPNETEEIAHTEQWVKCLRWVLEEEPNK